MSGFKAGDSISGTLWRPAAVGPLHLSQTEWPERVGGTSALLPPRADGGLTSRGRKPESAGWVGPRSEEVFRLRRRRVLLARAAQVQDAVGVGEVVYSAVGAAVSWRRDQVGVEVEAPAGRHPKRLACLYTLR